MLFLFLFASFGIHELFLFLFVQKLAPQIYSYSYLWEKLLFADHWSVELKTIEIYFKGMAHLTQDMASDDDFGPPE